MVWIGVLKWLELWAVGVIGLVDGWYFRFGYDVVCLFAVRWLAFDLMRVDLILVCLV